MRLVLNQISKVVGAETHIFPMDLELESGGFNVLMGGTMAGKTSLMHLLAGFSRPSSGDILCDGQSVLAVPVQKRRVSMVYQQFINYPHLSVYDNIASPLKVAGVAAAEVQQRVADITELLQLGPMLQRYPQELSGGQQQRTALARALVKDSDLVLLDEPLANLDYKLREQLRAELPRLFERRECIVVYATTEPEEALLLGGNCALLHEGKLCQFGATSKIYRQPANLTSARVFSDPPINVGKLAKSGEQISGDFLAIDSAAPCPHALSQCADGDYYLAIRPHELSLQARSDADVELQAVVKISEISGSESHIHFRLGSDDWVAQLPGVHSHEIGSILKLHMDLERALYFDSEQRLISSDG